LCTHFGSKRREERLPLRQQSLGQPAGAQSCACPEGHRAPKRQPGAESFNSEQPQPQQQYQLALNTTAGRIEPFELVEPGQLGQNRDAGAVNILAIQCAKLDTKHRAKHFQPGRAGCTFRAGAILRFFGCGTAGVAKLEFAQLGPSGWKPGGRPSHPHQSGGLFDGKFRAEPQFERPH